METTLKLAIETYSELSGIPAEQVTKECLVDGPVRESVLMLMFAAA